MHTSFESTHAIVRRGPLGALALLLGILTLLLTGCGLPGTISTGGKLPPVQAAAPRATPLPGVRFPQDEAPHNDLTEWWYYTGHLHGSDAQGHAHSYGFELTFFQTLRGQVPPYYAAHYAISDITRGQFHYDQRAQFASAAALPPGGARNGFHLALGGWTMDGLNGNDALHASMPGYTLNLALHDALPHPILHNGDGLISYGAAGFSYYYSRPLLRVSGTITDHGAQIPITGQAWFDHQWGNFISLTGSGWNWFSIQLDNHTEYMLYIIYDSQKRPISVFGTAVAADGTASELPASALHFQALGTWKSPVTGGVYPSGWRVTIDGASGSVSLVLQPLLKDQELVTGASTGVAYWEGAVGIQGQVQGQPVAGEGYVELTGYAQVPASDQSAQVP